MGIQNPKNIGSHVFSAAALVPQNVTANIAAKVANSTPSFDRIAGPAANFGIAQSMVLVSQTGALAGGGTFSLVQKVQDSADNTTFADYVPPPIAGLKQTVAPNTTITAANTVAETDVDLSGARQFLALDVKPNLAGGATGILAASTFEFGGFPTEPA